MSIFGGRFPAAVTRSAGVALDAARSRGRCDCPSFRSRVSHDRSPRREGARADAGVERCGSLFGRARARARDVRWPHRQLGIFHPGGGESSGARRRNAREQRAESSRRSEVRDAIFSMHATACPQNQYGSRDARSECCRDTSDRGVTHAGDRVDWSRHLSVKRARGRARHLCSERHSSGYRWRSSRRRTRNIARYSPREADHE